MPFPTTHQLDMMYHAIGGDKWKLDYRNYYSIGDDAPDADQWRLLIAAGFAVQNRPGYFHVSDEGRAALRRAGWLTKSSRRRERA